MKQLYFLLLVGTIILTAGCRKEHCENKDPEGAPKLASSRYYSLDGSHYDIEYKYTNHSKLIKEIHSGINGASFETYFHYQNDRLSIQEVGSSPKIAEFRYIYSNQLLAETEYIEYQSGPVKSHFKRSFVHQDSKIIKITEMNLENPGLSNYSLLGYTGENITSLKIFDLNTNQLSTEVQLGYDDKKNPFYGMRENTGDAKYTSRNNIIYVKTLVKNGNPVDESITYSYEYNSENYPVKNFWEYAGAGRLIEEIYFYE